MNRELYREGAHARCNWAALRAHPFDAQLRSPVRGARARSIGIIMREFLWRNARQGLSIVGQRPYDAGNDSDECSVRCFVMEVQVLRNWRVKSR